MGLFGSKKKESSDNTENQVETITLENGTTSVDISSLESGVYIFNVTMENGESTQFNVVKN